MTEHESNREANPYRSPALDVPDVAADFATPVNRQPLWRRVLGIAPWWAWAVAPALQIAVALPFWLYSSPAPYHDSFGDVFRGWPLIYGLDQGDVGGDEWGPFTTYFHPGRFALDTLAAAMCGLPATVAVFWGGRRVRNRTRTKQRLSSP